MPRRIHYSQVHQTVELEPAPGGLFEDYDKLVGRVAEGGGQSLPRRPSGEGAARGARSALGTACPGPRSPIARSTATCARRAADLHRARRRARRRRLRPLDGRLPAARCATSRANTTPTSATTSSTTCSRSSATCSTPGILNLRPDHTGKTNYNRIKGLLGTLIAARWFRKSGARDSGCSSASTAPRRGAGCTSATTRCAPTSLASPGPTTTAPSASSRSRRFRPAAASTRSRTASSPARPSTRCSRRDGCSNGLRRRPRRRADHDPGAPRGPARAPLPRVDQGRRTPPTSASSGLTGSSGCSTARSRPTFAATSSTSGWASTPRRSKTARSSQTDGERIGPDADHRTQRGADRGPEQAERRPSRDGRQRR